MGDLFNAVFKEQQVESDCEPLYTKIEIPEEINLPYSTIRDMTEEEYEVWADKFRLAILDLYENHNAPPITKGCPREEVVEKLRKFNNLDVIGNDKVYTDGVYIGLNTWSNAVNHWFPEMADVAISRGAKLTGVQPSIMDWFRNKDEFIRVSKMTIKNDRMGDFKKKPDAPIWPGCVQVIRIGNGNQPAVNIRGTVAKHIYQTEMLERCRRGVKDIVIYDPSMGWAGRMAGFLAATNHLELMHDTNSMTYIGTDPNSAIYERYHMIDKFWKKEINNACKGQVIPVCSGSETFDTTPEFQTYKGKVDMAFTSPPYFSKEQYSNEETQSWKKFNAYEEWREGFLEKTFENIYELLKDDGVVYWNIADLKLTKKKFLPLEDDSIKAAEKAGFELVKTCPMLMRYMVGRDVSSFMEGGRNVVNFQGANRKTEPIFKFKKKV